MKVHGDSLRASHRPAKNPGRLTPYEKKPGFLAGLPNAKRHVSILPVYVIRIAGIPWIRNSRASINRGKLDDSHGEIGGRSYRYHAFVFPVFRDLHRYVFGRQHRLVPQHLPYQKREREDSDYGQEPIADVPRGQGCYDSSPNMAGSRLDHAGLVAIQFRRGPGGSPNAARRIPSSDARGGERRGGCRCGASH